jgi:hypothetical protein
MKEFWWVNPVIPVPTILTFCHCYSPLVFSFVFFFRQGEVCFLFELLDLVVVVDVAVVMSYDESV